MKDFRGLAYREWKLLTGSHLNLILAVSTPTILITLFATSMARFVPTVSYEGGRYGYAQFCLPGLLVFSMVSAAGTCSTSLFQERLGGMEDELWAMPIRRWTYIAAKLGMSVLLILAETSFALILALAVLHISWPIGRAPEVLLSCVLAALSLLAGYLLLASIMRDQQRFLVATNLIGMVMLFGSASLYPENSLPQIIHAISRIDPMTYEVLVVRNSMLGDVYTTAAVEGWLALSTIIAMALVVRSLVRRARLG